MAMSASLKKATNKTSIEHNNREKNDYENDLIDPTKEIENKYFVQENIRELYAREFDDVTKKYNAKQKRSDRKIKSYYNHLQKGKKTAPQQEMIVQVGNKDDFLNNLENKELANEILEEWYEGFKERNPNLKIYNAVIHNDESSPHLHLNFVPVAEGYERGLEKQVSFNRAIIQQDVDAWAEYQALQERKKEHRNEQKAKGTKEPYPYEEWEKNLDDPFEAWRANEVGELEKLMNERGIERKLVGTNDYEDVNEYKQKKRELEVIEQQISEGRQQLEDLKGIDDRKEKALSDEKIIYENTIKEFKHLNEFVMPKGFREIDKEIVKKGVFGTEVVQKETGNTVFTPKDINRIKGAISSMKLVQGNYERFRTIAEEERKLRKGERQEHHQELQTFKNELNERAERLKDDQFKELEEENTELKGKLLETESEKEEFKGYVSEMLKENDALIAEKEEWEQEKRSLHEVIDDYKDKLAYYKGYASDLFQSAKDYFINKGEKDSFAKFVRADMNSKGYGEENQKDRGNWR